MNRAVLCDQRARIDADDASCWEEFLQNAQGLVIVLLRKGGYEHKFVGDKKVGVTCGQDFCFKMDRFRHGQRADCECSALCGRGVLQASEVLLECCVVVVRHVIRQHCDDRAFVAKSAKIVDMAVCIIAGKSIAEPMNGRNPKVVPEFGFEFCLVEVWVSVGVFQHTFGGEEVSGAIGFDGSTFEDEGHTS